MIENSDYFIRFVDFPTCSCGGMILLNDDGTYTILLNSRLSRKQNLDSMEHELTHIRNGDFYRDLPVSVIESEANNHRKM